MADNLPCKNTRGTGIEHHIKDSYSVPFELTEKCYHCWEYVFNSYKHKWVFVCIHEDTCMLHTTPHSFCEPCCQRWHEYHIRWLSTSPFHGMLPSSHYRFQVIIKHAWMQHKQYLPMASPWIVNYAGQPTGSIHNSNQPGFDMKPQHRTNHPAQVTQPQGDM